MADSLSEADKVILLHHASFRQANVWKIRNKRLAKLGSQSTSQAGTDGEKSSDGASTTQAAAKPVAQQGADPEEKEQPRPQINISKPSDSSLSSSNPFAQLGLKNTGKGPEIGRSSSMGKPITPMKRDRPSSGTGSPAPRAGESVEAWENRILSSVFRLTLDPGTSQASQLHFVGGVRTDLEEQGEAVLLNTAVLDQAILEAASNLKGITPLDYLLECWKRITRLLRASKGHTDEHKLSVLKEARRLCMSYCLFAITMPDMFG